MHPFIRYKGKLLSAHYNISRPLQKSTKRGMTCLCLPAKVFVLDLCIHVDVARNPGPTKEIAKLCRQTTSCSTIRSTARIFNYSRRELFALKKHRSLLNPDLVSNLKELGLFRTLGSRGGQNLNYDKRNSLIPVVISICARQIRIQKARTRNIMNLKGIPKRKFYQIPSVLSTNVRSVTNKINELHQVALLNRIDAICVTESWLKPDIPDSSVSLPNYNIFRKDRVSTEGGGVCIFLNSKFPCNRLPHCEVPDVESLWIQIRPNSLPRSVSSIILCVVYHSTSNREPENETLCHHICSNLDQLLNYHPNALIIVTGDFNTSSTGLKLKDLTHTNNLTQIVNFPTRDSGILDWFLTNRPDSFTLSQLPKIGRSDHYSVLARSSVTSTKTNYTRKIKTRDMRDSAWRPFGRWMIEKNWSNVYNAETCEEKFQAFMSNLHQAVDLYLPWRTTKVHDSDRPWITKKLKLLIHKRQNAFTRFGKHSTIYKQLRNKVQSEIRLAKQHYYKHKVSDLEQANAKKWWEQIEILSGQTCHKEWYHQFLDSECQIPRLWQTS